jgi:hypothetical protein
MCCSLPKTKQIKQENQANKQASKQANKNRF